VSYVVNAANDADLDVVRAFEDARHQLDAAPYDAAIILFELEDLVIRRLAWVRDQARRVAEANAAAAELVGETSAEAKALASKYEKLETAKAEIENRHGALIAEAGAAAEAAVEAVLMLESSEEKLEQLAHARQEALHKTAALERAASTDVLTGLFNRRFFHEQLAREILSSSERGHDIAVVYVDVDHFKHLNDTCGHQVGDEALSTVAKLIQRSIRWSDSLIRRKGIPFAARYGGEEFVIILPRTTADRGYAAAERLRRMIAHADIPGGSTQPGGRVSISCGVAARRPDDSVIRGGAQAVQSWATELIRQADRALYEAKRAGRDQVIAAGSSGVRESPAPSFIADPNVVAADGLTSAAAVLQQPGA
jgi:diguanylate cyclase (GGDEF)-like protein